MALRLWLWSGGLLVVVLLGAVVVSMAAAGGLPRQELAYYARQQRGGAVYLLDVPRQLSARMYAAPDWVLSMAWSPDGAQLAFTVHQAAAYDLVLIDANGRGARRLVEGRASNQPLVWSPDGQFIIYEASQAADTALYAVEVATGESHRLAGDGLSADFSWSPDAERAVFAMQPPGSASSAIYIMNGSCVSRAGRCEIERVTDDSAMNSAPAWSPDGTQIAFISDRGGQSQLYLLPCDADGCGGAGERLVDAEVYGTSLAWSPDGRWLIFGLSPGGFGSLLYLADMTCADCEPRFHKLTPDDQADSAAAWSPDGRYLAYVSRRVIQLPAIRVLDVACVDRGDCEGRQVTRGAIEAWAPAWRPQR